MAISRRVRYAAKSAYQLAVMVGRYKSTQCGMACEVHAGAGFVTVTEFKGRPAEQNIVHQVPIAKAWINL